MAIKPVIPISFKAIAQGNRKAISKSKIIKRIATRYYLTSKGILASSNSSKPHSYGDSFASDFSPLPKRNPKRSIRTPNTAATEIKIIIGK